MNPKTWKTLDLQLEGGIALVRFNRPEALNAINREMLFELDSLLDIVRDAPELHVLIFTGQGKAFIAGADVAQMQTFSPEESHNFTLQGQALFNRFEELGKPVIAAVNGYAFGGGCELALACDLRIASDKAMFGLPELNLGIIPGFGGTQRLSRAIGKAQALYYLYTGTSIPAQEALRLGLANQVVPEDQLLEATVELARRIMSKAPIALGLAKQAVHQGLSKSLPEGIALEAELFHLAFTTKDKEEGFNAFLEKRKPFFRGE